MDGVIVKAPKGGGPTGPNPTDWAKCGAKRHVFTDGAGIPLAVTLSAANVHDDGMLAPTLDAIVLQGGGGPRRPEHCCLDKGYSYADCVALLRQRAIIAHIRRKGEAPLVGRVRGRPRRWVGERTNRWHNRYRVLLIRWERRASSYLALVHLACALMCLQHCRF